MIIRNDRKVLRVLSSDGSENLVIDCIKRTMPELMNNEELIGYKKIEYSELLKICGLEFTPLSELDADSSAVAQQRYAVISPVLNVISDTKERSQAIRTAAEANNISKQTVRKYLCLYLIFQDKSVLAPKKTLEEKTLTGTEKTMRWALNSFFYNSRKNSLNTAYTLMLKEKYCDEYGELAENYPSYYQFRYFYRKTKKMKNYYISRNGLTDYERNKRPLLGDGTQQYAKSIGMGFLDSTVCDIYLVNNEGSLVGRPILTACVDAYSSLCNGYMLSWKGGVYSLRGLMINILTDKVEYCNKFGISIRKEQWDSDKLPGIFVTDKGSEYGSYNFSQLTEIGVTVENLPAYRPDLKGSVEKFFDLIQNYYKPILKGKGVIEPDFRERGAHDYRKDACLTLEEFEKIIIKCIVFYNSYRTLEKFPYTEEMLNAGVQPTACSVWNWGMTKNKDNLIDTTTEQVITVLLPRTTGKFARNGLIVNKLRYRNNNYTEKFLSSSTVTVAYDPDDVSYVWLIENGSFIRFELIESRFMGVSLDTAKQLKDSCKELINDNKEEKLKAEIELARFIETIANNSSVKNTVSVKDVNKSRKAEEEKTHISFASYIFGDEEDE